MAHLFISQERVARWTSELKVSLEDNLMLMLADRYAFALTPAVRVLRNVAYDGEGTDPSGLVGCVKTHEQLRALGAEPYLESLVLGEAAYEIQSGYVAVVLGDPSQAPTAAALRDKLSKEP
jgi:hypothetical protein